MPKQVLFIQGAGEGAYEADAKLARSLGDTLGSDYEIVYPAMPNQADPSFDAWRSCIEKEVSKAQEPVIFVAHSVGASVLLKYLSEDKVKKSAAGIFLIAAPFWGGDGWRYKGYEKLELAKDAETKLPQGAQVFLYHSQDDEIVPFEHLALYAKLLPHAKVRRQEAGGHQLDSDLTRVAQDIHSLALTS